MLAQSSIVPVCTNLCTAWQLLRMVWKVDMDDRLCSTGNMDEVSLFFFFFFRIWKSFCLMDTKKLLELAFLIWKMVRFIYWWGHGVQTLIFFFVYAFEKPWGGPGFRWSFREQESCTLIPGLSMFWSIIHSPCSSDLAVGKMWHFGWPFGLRYLKPSFVINWSSMVLLCIKN